VWLLWEIARGQNCWFLANELGEWELITRLFEIGLRRLVACVLNALILGWHKEKIYIDKDVLELQKEKLT